MVSCVGRTRQTSFRSGLYLVTYWSVVWFSYGNLLLHSAQAIKSNRLGFIGRISPKPNKLFKRDSQRVAFLLCVGLSDQGGMQRLRYCVAHPLTGRYKTRGQTWKNLNMVSGFILLLLAQVLPTF
ncbi:TPA: DUF3265 domain-containing protein [Vibrio parahaemolyticus]|nr:DUF3265 domain-containing protein [Vibrio parahaemolyticus]